LTLRKCTDQNIYISPGASISYLKPRNILLHHSPSVDIVQEGKDSLLIKLKNVSNDYSPLVKKRHSKIVLSKKTLNVGFQH